MNDGLKLLPAPRPTSSESELLALYHEVCLGHPDALRFLLHFNVYCHAIDDLVDAGERPNPVELVTNFAEANILYTLPFYQLHSLRLQLVIMLITNAYADSLLWEKEDDHGLSAMADVLRFAGNEMCFAIALICGGYQHMRRVSPKLRKRSWLTHHDENGARI